MPKTKQFELGRLGHGLHDILNNKNSDNRSLRSNAIKTLVEARQGRTSLLQNEINHVNKYLPRDVASEQYVKKLLIIRRGVNDLIEARHAALKEGKTLTRETVSEETDNAFVSLFEKQSWMTDEIAKRALALGNQALEAIEPKSKL
jgi:hypothetical protein